MTLDYNLVLRPCLVRLLVPNTKYPYLLKESDPQNALFHGWSHISDVVEPSPLKGGHPGGVVSQTVGIVELSDGKVAEVAPKYIQFIDNKHQEYAFPQEEQKDE